VSRNTSVRPALLHSTLPNFGHLSHGLNNPHDRTAGNGQSLRAGRAGERHSIQPDQTGGGIVTPLSVPRRAPRQGRLLHACAVAGFLFSRGE